MGLLRKRRIGAIAGLAGLLGVSARAGAQWPPPASSDPPECAAARVAARSGQMAQAQAWQRTCDAKHAAASAPSGSPAPVLAMPAFPSVADVQSAVRGADPIDTAARQEAAFAVLTELLEDVHHHHMNNAVSTDMPPDAARQWIEYHNAQQRAEDIVIPGKSRTTQVSTPALNHYFSQAFRRQILSRYASAAVVDDYEQRHWATQDAAETTRRAAEEQRAAANAPPRPRGNGMTLFSAVQFGEPLDLPGCGGTLAGMIGGYALFGPGGGSTCVGQRDAASASLAGRWLGITDVPPDVELVLVKLAPASCPDWKSASGSCVMGVALQKGLVASVGFETGHEGFEHAIVTAVGSKASGPPPSKSATTCQNNASAKYGLTTKTGTKYLWSWSTMGMMGGYWTTGGYGETCDQGCVLFSTQSFQAGLEKGVASHEASQPKL
jgi:hypothetical protein